MRNVIFGAIGVLWGGGIVLNALLGDARPADGPAATGRAVGQFMGVLLFVAGLYYLVTGLRGLGKEAPKSKKGKKKRRPVGEDS